MQKSRERKLRRRWTLPRHPEVVAPGGSWIKVAVIGAAHGVRGEVRVKALTGDPAGFGRYGALFIEGKAAALEIAAVTPLKDDLFRVRFAGISDRDAASQLNGLFLCVQRDQLPELDHNEYYHADLIGLIAVTDAGQTLGEVIAIDNFGAGDILEVRSKNGGDTYLIPFSQAMVPSIDLTAKRVIVSAQIIGAAPKPLP
jgi:16S rRNA processing protein RimM